MALGVHTKVGTYFITNYSTHKEAILYNTTTHAITVFIVIPVYSTVSQMGKDLMTLMCDILERILGQ